MADHAEVEYATATGNDLATHEATYESFLHLAFVVGATVVAITISLAVGGVQGHWLVAAAIILLATIVGAFGVVTGARAPSGVVVVLALLALAFGG